MRALSTNDPEFALRSVFRERCVLTSSFRQRVRRAALGRTSSCLPLADISVTPTIPPVVGTVVGEDFLIPLNTGHEDGFALFASFTFTFLLVVIASRLLRFGERQGSRRNWRDVKIHSFPHTITHYQYMYIVDAVYALGIGIERPIEN